jgi:fimbrial chaperone protein
MHRAALSQAVCGLALLAAVFRAEGGSFAVMPVRVTLSASQPVASIRIQNQDREPVVVQLEATAWSQQDGRDVHEATREVLATPPIFTIAPGGSQIVRLGLRRAPDPHRELTYRLFVHEVPPPPGPGFKGLRVALRISIPVFVAPPVAAAPVLQWRAAQDAAGALTVGLNNTGNAHIQVAEFRVAEPAGKVVGTRQIPAYVLAGQSRGWAFPVKASRGAPLRIFATTDSGDVQAAIVVE